MATPRRRIVASFSFFFFLFFFLKKLVSRQFWCPNVACSGASGSTFPYDPGYTQRLKEGVTHSEQENFKYEDELLES